MKIKSRLVSLLVILILLCSLSGCKWGNHTDSEFKIATTFFPIYDMTKSIVGDKASVKMLIMPGQDLHSYDPSTNDIIEVKKCDLFVYVGEALENWATKLVTNLSDSVQVLRLTDNSEIVLDDIHHEEEHEIEEIAHDVDPHIWTNPLYAAIIIKDITKKVIEIDPTNKEYYQLNCDAYVNELLVIDNNIRKIVSGAARKTLYFGCPFSFYYLTKQYGLEFKTVYDTCSIEADPSLDDIMTMTNEIKENNIPVVYTKELLNTAVAEKIVKGTNAELVLLHSGHNVSREDFNLGVTFIEIMRKNVDALQKGLE